MSESERKCCNCRFWGGEGENAYASCSNAQILAIFERGIFTEGSFTGCRFFEPAPDRAEEANGGTRDE